MGYRHAGGVTAVGGPQVQVSGLNFLAARVEDLLPTFSYSRVHLQQITDTIGNVVQSRLDIPGTYGDRPAHDPPQNDWTVGTGRGEAGRFGGATDVFDLGNLPGGLVAGDVQLTDWSMTVPASLGIPIPLTVFFICSGTFYYDGDFGGGWNGDTIRVTTDADTCHELMPPMEFPLTKWLSVCGIRLVCHSQISNS